MGQKSTWVPAPPSARPPLEPAKVTAAEKSATFPRPVAAASSNQDPATGKQPWNPTQPGYKFFSLPFDWGMDPRPQGGFVSYLRNPSGFPLLQQMPNQQAMLQNAHYTDAPSHHAPFVVSQPSVVTGTHQHHFPSQAFHLLVHNDPSMLKMVRRMKIVELRSDLHGHQTRMKD